MTAIFIIIGVSVYGVLYISGVMMLLFNQQAHIENRANDKQEFEQRKEAFAICSAKFDELSDIQNCMAGLTDGEAIPFQDPISGQTFAGVLVEGIKFGRDALRVAGHQTIIDDEDEQYQRDALKKLEDLNSTEIVDAENKKVVKLAAALVAVLVLAKLLGGK